MRKTRPFLLLLTAFLSVSWFTSTGAWKKLKAASTGSPTVTHKRSTGSTEKMKSMASEARSFTQKKAFNEDVCFLVDMSLPSGHSRFFIYDLKKDTLQQAGLVAHGNCFKNWLEGRRYSNVVGSGCTSLGKYRVGTSYTGKWGYSYKLHGLDSSNNNAYERTVVLHSHSCIPENEVSDDICQSNGCPTVSPGMLNSLKAIINPSKRPVLLWIYE